MDCRCILANAIGYSSDAEIHETVIPRFCCLQERIGTVEFYSADVGHGEMREHLGSRINLILVLYCDISVVENHAAGSLLN